MNKAHQYKMGIVGNCSYMAYVHEDSDVKWLCWPHFDGSFLFGSLLDEANGGHFKVVPSHPSSPPRQSYQDNTNILETVFTCTDGTFSVTDFAPRFANHDRFHRPLQFFRKIHIQNGRPKLKVIFSPPRHQSGEKKYNLQEGSNHLSFDFEGTPVRLTTNFPKSYLLSEKEIILNEDLYFVLSYGEAFEAPLRHTFQRFQLLTAEYWKAWIQDTYVPLIFQAPIIRSALTLKLHQFEETGAIIAAGSMGLPEYPGSGRNWDYRYCWIRDTYFTLLALNSLGHFEEVEKYSQFIHNCGGDFKTLRPLYTIRGEDKVPESVIDLPGYLGNRPVRLGNEAYLQIQNDVYGQILLSLLPLYIDRRLTREDRVPTTDTFHRLVEEMQDRILHPDAGIWEFRGKQQRHLLTYIFHWAGAKGALKVARQLKDPALERKALALIDASVERIEACYDREQMVYTMAEDNPALDASSLLLVTMNYLKGDDPRAKRLVELTAQELGTKEGLIFRYRALDDFGETHATFLICGFWYAEALVCLGKLEEAKQQLEKLIGMSNHLQLFSEDVAPDTLCQWGNFPQTYAHVGLINAALRLARKLDALTFE